MNHKYSIGFFAIMLGLMAAVSVANHWEFQRVKELAEEEKIISTKEVNDAESVRTTDGHAKKAECFYLAEEQGYVIVLKSDKKTIYEYTNIKVEDLPDLIQTEVKNGKMIESEKDLFGFLENYSS